MVSLILYSLALSSMYLNYPNSLNANIRTNCEPDAYYTQDNSVVNYRYMGSDEGDALLSYNRYELYFSGGQQFTFEIEVTTGVDGSNDWWDLKFKVWQESYLTNLYLSNIKVNIYGDNDSDYFYLHDVYFLGQSQYYDDNESGNYTIFFPSSENANLELDFDIGLVSPSLVDGSQYQNGYTEGWNDGNDNGFADGFNNGYTDGYNDAVVNLDTQGSTALTIFTGIIDVGLLPINVFLAMMNFEVFGINIGGLVSSLMTVAIAIIIFRVIFNGGASGGGKS